jgi:hypothetical protein
MIAVAHADAPMLVLFAATWAIVMRLAVDVALRRLR